MTFAFERKRALISLFCGREYLALPSWQYQLGRKLASSLSVTYQQLASSIPSEIARHSSSQSSKAHKVQFIHELRKQPVCLLNRICTQASEFTYDDHYAVIGDHRKTFIFLLARFLSRLLDTVESTVRVVLQKFWWTIGMQQHARGLESLK